MRRIYVAASITAAMGAASPCWAESRWAYHAPPPIDLSPQRAASVYRLQGAFGRDEIANSTRSTFAVDFGRLWRIGSFALQGGAGLIYSHQQALVAPRGSDPGNADYYTASADGAASLRLGTTTRFSGWSAITTRYTFGESRIVGGGTEVEAFGLWLRLGAAVLIPIDSAGLAVYAELDRPIVRHIRAVAASNDGTLRAESSDTDVAITPVGVLFGVGVTFSDYGIGIAYIAPSGSRATGIDAQNETPGALVHGAWYFE